MKRFAAIFVLSISSALVWSAAPDDVKAVHAKVITPASNALFDAESTPPSTAQGWDEIRASAADLGRAAARLAANDLARDRAQWIEFARALQAQAQRAVSAAAKKDRDALVTANGDIVAVCEDCHTKFRDGGRSMKQ